MIEKLNKRENWIDVSRGLAIILVVLGHVVTSFQNSGIQKFIFSRIHKYTFPIYLPLFFFISGYLFSKNKKSTKDKIINSFYDYGIPYFLFSIIYFVIKTIMNKYVNTSLSMLDLMIIPIKPIGFMWFLYALFIMRVIISVVNIKKYKHYLVFFSIIIYSFSRICISYDLLLDLKSTILFDFNNYFLWFLCGYLSKESRIIKKIFHREYKVGFLIVLFIIYVFLQYIYTNLGYNFATLFFIMSVIGILFIIILSKKISCGFIINIGKNTMPIYLLHTIIIAFLRVLLLKIPVINDNIYLVFILCFIGGLLIPYYGYKIIKKLSFIDFIFYPKKYIKGKKI